MNIRATLKQQAATSRGTTTQLVVESTTDGLVQVHAALGNQDLLKHTLRRQQAKHLLVNPATMCELVIDGDWVIVLLVVKTVNIPR